jgi:beta-lactamase class A
MRLLLITALLAGPLLRAQPARTPESLLEAGLLDRLRSIDSALDGVLGVAAIDLTTGHVIAHHADVVFPQASSIKIPIMMHVFEQERAGRFKLSDSVTVEMREAVGGSGHLRLMLRERPVQLTIVELVTAMIETSDNTATNKLIALVGMNAVNSMLDRLGFRETRLRRVMLDGAAAAKNDENVSTPLEMARIAELIYRGKAVDQEASRQMAEILKLVNADFRKSVPVSVAVASKPGGLTGVRCETGIIFARDRPFVLSVASSFLTEPENPVQAVSKLFYEHFSKLGRSNKFGNGGVR